MISAIQLAYSVAHAAGVVAHMISGVETSSSLEEVCAVAGGASSMTFARLYRLNVA